jgi:hypothetical protein
MKEETLLGVIPQISISPKDIASMDTEQLICISLLNSSMLFHSVLMVLAGLGLCWGLHHLYLLMRNRA